MTTTIPFTLIEEMTHHIERAFRPLNMQGELESSATVDIERLEAATRRAMELHPMSRARRRPATPTDAGYSWEIPDDPGPVRIREVDGDEVELRTLRNRLYGRRFDLTEEPPFEIVVYRGGGIDGGDHILQSTSHVAADGVGTLRFGRAIWTAYRGEEPMRDPVSLQDSRAMLDELQPSTLADGVAAVDSVTRRLREGLLDPTDIASDGGSGADGWGYARRYLDESLTGRFLGGRPDGVSVNDVLLAALHLAIDGWNADHGKPTGRLSVMMPVNVRPDGWFYQVMAMYSLFESVRTDRGDRHDPRDTIDRVARQTTRIKERDRAEALYKAVALLPPGTPVGLKRQVPRILEGPGERLTDTAILTNLGNIPAYPSLGADSTERAWFSPPTWDAVPVGVGVGTFGGELNLFCRYRLSVFDTDAAERFVDTYVDHIERLVDETLPTMTAATA